MRLLSQRIDCRRGMHNGADHETLSAAACFRVGGTAKGGVPWLPVEKSEKNVLRGVTPGEQEEATREIETTLQHEGFVAHPMDRVHQMEQRLHHHLTNHPKYQFNRRPSHSQWRLP